MTAIAKIYAENPAAITQIVVSIATTEVLCVSIDAQGKFSRPGDYGKPPVTYLRHQFNHNVIVS